MKIIKWEYKTFSITKESNLEKFTNTLCQLGEQGWEMVSFNSCQKLNGDIDFIVFKRPCGYVQNDVK